MTTTKKLAQKRKLHRCVVKNYILRCDILRVIEWLTTGALAWYKAHIGNLNRNLDHRTAEKIAITLSS